MSRWMVSMAVCIGGMPFSAWAQEVEPLPDDEVAAVLSIKDFEEPIDLIFCSRKGLIKRTALPILLQWTFRMTTKASKKVANVSSSWHFQRFGLERSVK